MNGFSDFIQGVVRGAVKLLVLLAAAVFLVSLLLAAVAVMLGVSIWLLVTGRRPDPARIFTQFRQSSARFTPPGGWPRQRDQRTQGRSDGQVVDVQAHEVPDNSDGKSRSGSGGRPPENEPMARVVH
jgi:hypothetical protein